MASRLRAAVSSLSSPQGGPSGSRPPLGPHPAQGGRHFLLIRRPEGRLFLVRTFSRGRPLSPPPRISSRRRRPRGLRSFLAAGDPSPGRAPRPTGHAPQPRERAGRAHHAAQEGRAARRVVGACPPPRCTSIGRAAERGGIAAWVSGPASAQGILRGCGYGLGCWGARAATPVGAPWLRSGTHRMPKPGGNPTPSRVSPASPRDPWGRSQPANPLLGQQPQPGGCRAVSAASQRCRGCLARTLSITSPASRVAGQV